MKPIDQPLFPLKVIHLDDGLTVELNDLQEVGTYLEFYDSDGPEDSKEVLVLDRAGRRVRVFVDCLEVKRCTLYEADPLSEEEIASLVAEARQAQKKVHKQSLWGRFRKWFRKSE
ncbi:MAG: hypothetical protein NZT92_23600 [Abditibacteriales bacterium]|nr:hypothetical protein [Abditibacteriales bacterium]